MDPSGMVDALRAAHAAIDPGGVVLDVRPSSRHDARVDRRARTGWRPVARVITNADARADDRAADAAVRTALRLGLFRRVRGGSLWVRLPAMELADIERSIEGSLRFGGLAARPRHTSGSFSLRRPIQFAVLERR